MLMHVHSCTHMYTVYICMGCIFFHVCIFNMYVFHKTIYVCMDEDVCASIHIYVYGCVCNWAHVYTCTCTYTHHMHMYMYAYVHIHIIFFSGPFEKTCCLLTHINSLFFPKTKDIVLYLLQHNYSNQDININGI